jgi:hypothetical protein
MVSKINLRSFYPEYMETTKVEQIDGDRSGL